MKSDYDYCFVPPPQELLMPFQIRQCNLVQPYLTLTEGEKTLFSAAKALLHVITCYMLLHVTCHYMLHVITCYMLLHVTL